MGRAAGLRHRRRRAGPRHRPEGQLPRRARRSSPTCRSAKSNTTGRTRRTFRKGAIGGANEPWRAHVIDQTHPEWPRFFLERIVAPLWNAGYRGFFLDTLDSFQLISKTDEERARQVQGLAGVIRALRKQYPEAKLIFNRGFEILPELHREAYAVAVESIYRGWDQRNGRYVEVSEADRKWLMPQLTRAATEYKLPVIAIEYAPPGEHRARARDGAQSRAARLHSVGRELRPRPARRRQRRSDAAARPDGLPGHRQPVRPDGPPRASPRDDAAQLSRLQRRLRRHHEPAAARGALAGRYAGIVTWFTADQAIATRRAAVARAAARPRHEDRDARRFPFRSHGSVREDAGAHLARSAARARSRHHCPAPRRYGIRSAAGARPSGLRSAADCECGAAPAPDESRRATATSAPT